MLGFREIDDIDRLSVHDCSVQGSQAVNSDNGTPVGVFLQRSVNFALTLERHHLVEIVQGRRLQAEPVAETDDLEDFKETGGRDERTVKRVRAAVKVVDTAGKSPQTYLQFRLGRLVVGLENPLRFRGKQFLFDEREILPDDFPHLVPDRFQFFVRGKINHATSVLHFHRLPDFTVETAGQGMVNDQDLVGIEFPDGILQDEAERTDVGSATVRVVVSDEFHLVENHRFIRQFLKFVVDEGCDDFEFFPGFGVGHARAVLVADFLKGTSYGDPVIFPVVDAEDRDVFVLLLHFEIL